MFSGKDTSLIQGFYANITVRAWPYGTLYGIFLSLLLRICKLEYLLGKKVPLNVTCDQALTLKMNQRIVNNKSKSRAVLRDAYSPFKFNSHCLQETRLQGREHSNAFCMLYSNVKRMLPKIYIDILGEIHTVHPFLIMHVEDSDFGFLPSVCDIVCIMHILGRLTHIPCKTMKCFQVQKRYESRKNQSSLLLLLNNTAQLFALF